MLDPPHQRKQLPSPPLVIQGFLIFFSFLCMILSIAYGVQIRDAPAYSYFSITNTWESTGSGVLYFLPAPFTLTLTIVSLTLYHRTPIPLLYSLLTSALMFFSWIIVLIFWTQCHADLWGTLSYDDRLCYQRSLRPGRRNQTYRGVSDSLAHAGMAFGCLVIIVPNTPMTSANGAATFAPAPACSSGAPVADGDPVLAVRFPAFVVTPDTYPLGSPDPDATPDGNTALLVTSVLSALSVFVSYAGTLTPAAVVGSSTSLSLSTEEAEGADVALAEPHPGRKSGEGSTATAAVEEGADFAVGRVPVDHGGAAEGDGLGGGAAFEVGLCEHGGRKGEEGEGGLHFEGVCLEGVGFGG
ncbi:hypothetical protein GRF29_28g2149821 [Pseudopithomyces chartarum]|uniref:Uncharacterized protein n=1 Tax=Pseudopithomyces chartarum TaxID=1892770 RepID=A0AAN6RI51_9PLEO|nr:hypothetical protein GRF29_28g2149821 [Pseudopithomyces chartarum]